MRKWFALLIVMVLAFPALSPAYAQGKGKGGGGNGSKKGGWIGTITGLQEASAGTTFTLVGDPKHSVTVTATSSTTVTNRADGSPATLGNGLHVDVSGAYDSKTNTVAATAIKIDDSVCGTVGNLQVTSSGDTFDLTVAANQTLSIVMTSATTVKNASDGSAATLTEGQQVKVTGTYDATTKTYLASAIVVNDRKAVDRGFGTVSNLQSTTTGSTFTLKGHRGETVTVATTATTKITHFSDNSAGTLANGQEVCVSGTYDATAKTLTATSLVINDKKPKNEHQYAAGTIASLDATNGAFTLTVTQASITPTTTTITVKVTSGTQYRGAKGKKIAFSDLTVGAAVRAEGTFDATTQTLTATSICLTP